MLSKELVRKIRRLEISANALAQSELGGHYHSLFRGQGMEVSDLREYFPGDDVRAIDWNVSARMGRTHVKLFEEEREKQLVLMVDISGSVFFGTQKANKREVAAEIAAILAFSAHSQGDSVGLVLFSDRVELYVPPRKGRTHVLRILREIYAFTGESLGSDLSPATELMMSVCRRRAIGVLISDFVCEDWERALRKVSRRHEIISVVVSDPFEGKLPSLGLVTFRDAETGEQCVFDTSGPEARTYRESYALRVQSRGNTMRKMGADFVELSTEGNHVDIVLKFFRARALARRRPSGLSR